jgi:hypothetical protein
MICMGPMYVTNEFTCRKCPLQLLESLQARRSHDMSEHNVCAICILQCSDWADLKAHCRQTKCLDVCEGCGHRGAFWWNENEYQQHKHAKNVCDVCESHFGTPSNLIHVTIPDRRLVLRSNRVLAQTYTPLGHLRMSGLRSRLHDLWRNDHSPRVRRMPVSIRHHGSRRVGRHVLPMV